MRVACLVLLLLLMVVIRRICGEALTIEEIEDAIDNMEFEEQMEDMFTHMLRHCNFALCKPLREYNDYICEHFWLYLGTRLFLYLGPGNVLMAYTLKWVLMAICFCVGWWDGPEYTPDDDEDEPETELQARIRASRAPRDSRSFGCNQQQPAAAAATSSADEVETVEAVAEEGRVGNIRRLRRQSMRFGETLGLMGNSGSDSDNE